jgi:hypothetical protein
MKLVNRIKHYEDKINKLHYVVTEYMNDDELFIKIFDFNNKFIKEIKYKGNFL